MSKSDANVVEVERRDAVLRRQLDGPVCEDPEVEISCIINPADTLTINHCVSNCSKDVGTCNLNWILEP